MLNRVDVDAATAIPLTAAAARVAHVSVAHLLTRSWAADYQRLQQVDVHIAAELALATSRAPRPCALAAHTSVDAAGRDPEERRSRLTARSREIFGAWDAAAATTPEPGPLPLPFVAKLIDELTNSHERVLANGHMRNWALRLWSLERPLQYLGGQGGAGLGYGLGASIGAALAHRESERLVIDLQSDGDALFTPSALWTAAHYRLPLLVVMENNRARTTTPSRTPTGSRPPATGPPSTSQSGRRSTIHPSISRCSRDRSAYTRRARSRTP